MLVHSKPSSVHEHFRLSLCCALFIFYLSVRSPAALVQAEQVGLEEACRKADEQCTKMQLDTEALELRSHSKSDLAWTRSSFPMHLHVLLRAQAHAESIAIGKNIVTCIVGETHTVTCLWVQMLQVMPTAYLVVVIIIVSDQWQMGRHIICCGCTVCTFLTRCELDEHMQGVHHT